MLENYKDLKKLREAKCDNEKHLYCICCEGPWYFLINNRILIWISAIIIIVLIRTFFNIKTLFIWKRVAIYLILLHCSPVKKAGTDSKLWQIFFFSSSIWCFGRKLIGIILTMVSFTSQSFFFFFSLKHWEKLNFHNFQNWVKKYSRRIFKDDNGLKLRKESLKGRTRKRVPSSFWLKQKSDFPRSTSDTHEFQFSISFLSLSLFPSLHLSLSLFVTLSLISLGTRN